MDANDISLKKLMDLLKSNPKDITAFRGLEEQYFHSKNWKQLSELYQFRASAIKQGNPNESAHLYYKSGDILEKRLGNKEEALVSYQNAFTLNANKKEYGDVLVSFYTGQENWQKALDILQGQLKIFQAGNMSIDILLKMAYLWKEKIQNREEAKKCLQQILALNKKEENALRFLEELYYQDGEWKNLLGLYQYRLDAATDPIIRSKILERCALLCQEEINDWSQAIQYYGQLLQINPKNMTVLNSMEKLYERTENWQYVVEIKKRQVPLLKENREKIGALIKIATILREKLQNSAEAAQSYEHAFALGQDPTILPLLEDAYGLLKDWKRLASVYEREAKLTGDQKEQIELYCKIGAIANQHLQNTDMALQWYQAAYQAKGADIELLRILQNLLHKQGNIQALIENYYREIELLPGESEKLVVYDKIASIYKEQNDPKGAAEVYEKALEKHSGYYQAIENLKSLYESLEDYPALIRTLEREVSADNPQKSIANYLKIAEILKDKMGQEKQAVEYYRKILELDKANLPIWELMEDYHRRTENHSELVATLGNIIKLDSQRAESGQMEIARIYRDQLNNADFAIESFKKVLALNSRSLEAITSLQALYKEQNAWQSYIEMVCRQIELSIDAELLTDLHFKAYEAYRELGDSGSQEKHLRNILKIQHDNKVAISQLKSLYGEQKNWADLIVLLEREPQLFGWDNETLFERYNEIAGIYREKLENVPRTIDYYEKARNLEPTDLPVLENLERLYTQTKNYRKLVGALATKARLCEKEDDLLTLYHRMGIVWEDRLNDQKMAIQCFRHVADIDLTNMAAINRLKDLYEGREEYEALAEIYAREYRAVSENGKKVEVSLKCGEIWEKKLGNPDRAAECYAQTLKWDAGNARAIESLFNIYRQRENWAKLCGIYEKKIAILEDNGEKIRLKFELAALLRDRLDAPDKAISTYNDILAIDGKNLQAVYSLKELYGKLTRWDDLLGVLKKECELTGEDEKKKKLFVQMAELCEEKSFKFSQAIEHYLAALNYDAGHIPYLQALRRIYYKIQDYAKVVWSIDRELQVDTENLDLLFEKGGLLNYQLSDSSKALEAFDAVLAIDPANEKAYENLLAIYRDQQNYDKISATLTRQIQISNQEKQKELWLQCGKLWKDYLDDYDKAKECLKESLKLDVSFQPARELLAGIYREIQDWNQLLDHYQQELSFTQDSEKSAKIHCEMAKIWDLELCATDQALSFYHKTLELAPSDLTAIQNLQRIYLREEKFPELLNAYQVEQGLVEVERERRIYLYTESALLQRKLDDLDGAIQSYLSILDFALDPNNLIAVRGLEEIYLQQEKYKDLQNMLFKELELQKDNNRLIEVHLQLASVLEEKLDNLDVAIEHFSEAHLSRPESLYILRRLKKLLHARERWEKYTEVLEKEIALCSFPQEIVPLRRELLDIYNDKLDKQEKAIEHGEALLELEKDDLNAIVKLESLYEKGEQLEKLIGFYLQEASLRNPETDRERIVLLYAQSGKLQYSLENLPEAARCYQKVLTLEPNHKEAIAKLAKALSSLQQWDELIQHYEMTAKITRNKMEKETLYLKIGDLWEKQFQQLKEALLSYQIVYTMNSQCLPAVAGMCRIFEQQERWGDLVEFLNVEAYLVDEKKQPALFLKMGEIWEEKLGMPQQALSCYLKVMGHGFHRGTAERIMRIQQEVGDYEGLVEILKKDIRVTENPEELIPKLLTLGQIEWRHLDDREEATEVYSKVLAIQENQMEAIDSLAMLLPLQNKWEETIAILNRKRENISELDQLLEVYLKIGELHDTKMHNGNMAINYYEHALELSPQDLELIHTLQRLYRDWGYYRKLINLNVREIQLINDQQRIISLYEEGGEIWEKRLFAEEQAIRTYEKLLEIDPGHIGGTRALARLYKKHQAWDKLIAVSEKLIADAQSREDREEEIKINARLGELYRDELHDIPKAIESYKRIVELEPAHNQALEALEALYKTVNRSSEMADLLRQKLTLAGDDLKRMELYIHLGTLYEKELDDPDHAIEAFEQALTIDPKQLTVLKALDWLYLRKSDWDRLSEICIREYELLQDTAEKAELCYRIGALHRDRFRKPDEAREWFARAVETVPSMRKALKALTGLAILGEDWTQAVRYISQEIEHIDNPQEKVEALTDLGGLYEGKLKLIQKAKETFQLALDIDPKSVVSIEAMTGIHFQQNEWIQAEALLGRLSMLADKEEAKKLSEIYYKWGYVAEQLGKKDEAIIRYNSSLDSKQDNLNALQALGNLYFERAQWGLDKAQWREALEVYQKIAQHPEIEDRQVINRRLALIQANLEMRQEAIENYRKVLMENPEKMEVIMALANLHIELEENEYAIEYLNRIVKSETSSFQDKRKALLTTAEVLCKMEKDREAIDAYQRSFSMGLEDPKVLKNLGKLYMKIEDWENAQGWIDKHYTCLEDANEKLENRCLLAKTLLEGRNEPEQALNIYRQALQISPKYIPAIQGIAAIYEKQEKWEELAQNYKDFLTNLPKEDKVIGIPIHLVLGRLYVENLDDTEQAAKEYNKILELDNQHIAARAALANIKAQNPLHQEEAINEHVFLLRKSPFRIDSYRAFYNIFRAREEIDRAYRACRTLAFMNSAIPEEQKFLQSIKIRTPKNMDMDRVGWYLVPVKAKVYREVMAIAGPHMTKVYSMDMEQKYGVKPRKDRLMEGTGAAGKAKRIVRQIQDLMGIKELDIYLSRKASMLHVENTQPPSLIIGQGLLENFSEPELRFIFAKYLFFIAQKQILACTLDEKNLSLFFKLLQSNFLKINTARSEDESLLKKIRGALPRKVRKTLEDRIDLWREMAKSDAVGYARQIEIASNRCAFAITDSLELSVQMIYRLLMLKKTGKLISTTKLPMQELAKSESISDLLLYNISEEYGKLRKAAGMDVVLQIVE